MVLASVPVMRSRAAAARTARAYPTLDVRPTMRIWLMSNDAASPRSRRAILAAAAGAAAAAVVSAIERPLPVRAADGDFVHQGDTLYGGSTTTFYTMDATALGAVNESDNSPAFNALSYGSGGSTAIQGMSQGNGHGVSGICHEGTGVRGFSISGLGVVGDGGIEGVRGVSWDGTGVVGRADAGIGGHFASASGTALQVVGKAKFDRAGRVLIKKGTSKYRKTLAGVTSSTQVFAVLRTYRSGTYVAAVVCGSGYFTIRLNKALTRDTYCSYFVVN